MTNWLAAGLVFTRAAIISSQPQADMNKGNEEGRMEMGMDQLAPEILEKLMQTHSS